MLSLKTYEPSMQADIECIFRAYMADLGIAYDAQSRHHDIGSIPETYMENGCMWCLYDADEILGMVAVRALDRGCTVAELKRLYVLPAFNGLGYGDVLFVCALNFAKESGFAKILLDTRRDRVAAHHLFRKYGFTETGRYNDNEHAELFFELDLGVYQARPLHIFFPAKAPRLSDFVVIAARHKGKWVLVRKKGHETYELPGGHVEPGETVLCAARRELYEETGAAEYTITPIRPYGIARSDAVSAGMLFFADITHLGDLPDYEIEERVLAAGLPENPACMTYPAIQPTLMQMAQDWVSVQGNGKRAGAGVSEGAGSCVGGKE
jgi:8-oxo-dGTP diphosphatase